MSGVGIRKLQQTGLKNTGGKCISFANASKLVEKVLISPRAARSSRVRRRKEASSRNAYGGRVKNKTKRKSRGGEKSVEDEDADGRDSESDVFDDEEDDDGIPYFTARIGPSNSLLKQWSSEESIVTALSLFSISTIEGTVTTAPERRGSQTGRGKLWKELSKQKSGIFRLGAGQKQIQTLTGLLKREKIDGLDWDERHLLFLCGQRDPKANIRSSSIPDITTIMSSCNNSTNDRPKSAKSIPNAGESVHLSQKRADAVITYYHPGEINSANKTLSLEYRKRRQANKTLESLKLITGYGDAIEVYYPETERGPMMSHELRILPELGEVLHEDVLKNMGQKKYSYLCEDSLVQYDIVETTKDRNLRIFNWLVDVRNS